MTTTLSPVGRLVDRRPAWLLMATLPAYVVYVVVSVVTIAKEVDTSSELSPAMIDDLGMSWVGVHVLWVVPPLLAAAAMARLSHQLRGRFMWAVPMLAATTVLAYVTYFVINLAAFRVETPTWGDSALYPWSVVASLFAGWFGVHLASLIVIAALVKAGIAKRTAMVVGVLYALYFAFEVLTYLPIVVGPETFDGFLGGLPPFLLGFFWAAVGGALLRTAVPSEG